MALSCPKLVRLCLQPLNPRPYTNYVMARPDIRPISTIVRFAKAHSLNKCVGCGQPIQAQSFMITFLPTEGDRPIRSLCAQCISDILVAISQHEASSYIDHLHARILELPHAV